MRPFYHVFIDEAGDPGVKPKARNEAHWTDWFVISAVVLAPDHEPRVVDWLDEMRAAIGRKSRAPFHYRNLSDESRVKVCDILGSKPLRIFAVASHKDSMRRHESRKLGRATSQDFYNWCLRLLLERVTHWCANRCAREGRPTQPARLIFSERGGHSYENLKGYIRRLEAQGLTGKLVLDANRIWPNVIRETLFEVVPHANLAGLQLADITASAFFHGANTHSPKHSLAPAERLLPRLARKDAVRSPNGYGLLLLPFPHQGSIPADDRPIFERCGYSFG